MENKFTPTEFLAVMNQTLECAYSSVVIVGEVASFKVNQGKWVFFDLKDEGSSVGCFMTLWSLRQPIEDGMKVMVRGVPKVTKWGKFSFTVNKLTLIGEGSLKKAYEILKKKLKAEGLFDDARKRPISKDLIKLGVISSAQAAGYADFVKILNARWGGIKIYMAHTQVQGMDAPDQIMRALRYFNERGEVDAIAILRGGGSADDLACFNDEALVREVAASRIPIITGIGHEVDETLCDLAADVRASTPSNAAEMLTRDRKEEKEGLRLMIEQVKQGVLVRCIEPMLVENKRKMEQLLQKLQGECRNKQLELGQKMKILEALNPEKVLKQGYAIMAGRLEVGNVVKITTFKSEIDAEVRKIRSR